ncbi:hypothetical protein ACOME3_004847 [Neoechinorhynchus agilis]
MTGPFKTKAPKKSTSLVQQAKSIDNSPLSPRHPFVKNKESIDRSSSSSSVMRYISNGDLFKLEISELYVIPSTWSCANQSPITVSSLSITTIRQQMRRGSLKYKEYHLVPVTKTFINAKHPILRKTSNVVVFEETFSCSRQSSTLSLSQVVVIPTECFPREKEESVFLIDIWPKNPTTLAEDGEKRGKCGCYRASLEVRSMVKLEKEIFSIKSTEDEESDVHELNGDLRFETVMGEKDQSSFQDEEIHKESTVENDIVSTNYESDMENPAEKQSHSSSPKIDIDKDDGDLECHRFIFEDEKSLLLKEQGQISENPAEKQSRSSSPKIDIDKDDGDLECHRFIFEDEKSLLLKEQGQSFSKCEMKTVSENPAEKQSRSSSPKIDIDKDDGDLECHRFIFEDEKSLLLKEQGQSFSKCEMKTVSENPAEKQSRSSSPKIDIDKDDGDLECHRFIFEDEKSLLLKEQGQSFSKCEMKTVSENPAEKQSRSSSPKIDIDKDDGDLECHRFIFEDEKSLLLKEQGQSFSKCEMKTVPENPDETLPATYIKDNGKDEFVGDDQCYRILLEGDESRLLREDGWLVSFMENEEVRVHEALEQDPLTFAPEKCFRFLLEGEHSILLQDESEGDTFCVPVAHNGPKHKFHDDSKSVFVKEDFEERKVELKEQGRHESTAIDSCYVFRFENGENILLSEEGHSWPENGFEVNIPSLCILEQHMNAVPDSEKHGQIHLIFKKDIENVSTIKCVSGSSGRGNGERSKIVLSVAINIQRTRLKSKCIQSSSEETISIDYRFGYDSFEDARRRNSNLKGETVNSGGDGPSLDKNPVQNNDLLAELYQVDKIYNDDLEDLPPIRVGAKSPFPRRKLARLIEYAIAFKEQKHEKYEKKCELDDVLIPTHFSANMILIWILSISIPDSATPTNRMTEPSISLPNRQIDQIHLIAFHVSHGLSNEDGAKLKSILDSVDWYDMPNSNSRVGVIIKSFVDKVRTVCHKYQTEGIESLSFSTIPYYSPKTFDRTTTMNTDETEMITDETEMITDETEMITDETEMITDETEMITDETEMSTDEIATQSRGEADKDEIVDAENENTTIELHSGPIGIINVCLNGICPTKIKSSIRQRKRIRQTYKVGFEQRKDSVKIGKEIHFE